MIAFSDRFMLYLVITFAKKTAERALNISKDQDAVCYSFAVYLVSVQTGSIRWTSDSKTESRNSVPTSTENFGQSRPLLRAKYLNLGQSLNNKWPTSQFISVYARLYPISYRMTL